MRTEQATTLAEELMHFIRTDTIPAMTADRAANGLSTDCAVWFMVAGWDCATEEAPISERFKANASIDELTALATTAGCCVTANESEALQAIIECKKKGDHDVSLFDLHRMDATLLHITFVRNS